MTRNEYYAGHCILDSDESYAAPSWKLQAGVQSGQMELTGLVRGILQRRRYRVPRPAVIFNPWQADPPLQSSITIDLSHHHPRSLPAPHGWEIIQRNADGRVSIVEHSKRVTKLDAVQYHMLLTTCCDQEGHDAPTTPFSGTH